MPEAVTPPNPDQSSAGRHGNPPQSVPDPTLMTIDALRREIAMLEGIMSARLDALADRVQCEFVRVDALLSRDEEQRREQKADTKVAVDDALASQKEATNKMEASVSSQITSLRDNFETAIRAVQSNISDLKDRMTTAESVKQGAVDQRTETRQVSSSTVASIGVGIALLLAILTIISFMATGA